MEVLLIWFHNNVCKACTCDKTIYNQDQWKKNFILEKKKKKLRFWNIFVLLKNGNKVFLNIKQTLPCLNTLKRKNNLFLANYADPKYHLPEKQITNCLSFSSFFI